MKFLHIGSWRSVMSHLLYSHFRGAFSSTLLDFTYKVFLQVFFYFFPAIICWSILFQNGYHQVHHKYMQKTAWILIDYTATKDFVGGKILLPSKSFFNYFSPFFFFFSFIFYSLPQILFSPVYLFLIVNLCPIYFRFFSTTIISQGN